MADQQVNDNGLRCLRCPTGSIALVGGDTPEAVTSFIEDGATSVVPTLNEGATFCDAW